MLFTLIIGDVQMLLKTLSNLIIIQDTLQATGCVHQYIIILQVGKWGPRGLMAH